MTSPADKLRWGIVSTSKISSDLLQSLKMYYPEAEFVAVASRNQETADEFGKANGISKCYGSYDQLLADPEVDVVYVSTLNPFHKDPVIKALKSGKHVLCEKPFCMSAAEAREMVAVAREEKKFLMEAMWTRYFPASKKLAEIISNGELGEIVSLRGQFGFELVGRDVARLVRPDLGGGALMDIGIYLLSFVHSVFRKYPKTVQATAIFQHEIDWHTTVLLGYETGQAVLDFGFDSQFYETQVFIVGTKGSVKVCHPFFAPTKLVVTTKEKGEEIFDYPIDKGDHPWNFSESASLFHEIKYMEEAIGAGKLESEILPLDESLLVIELADEIRRQINLVYPWEK